MRTGMTDGVAIGDKAQARTFFLVIAVQFISTAADNALLIVAIARVIELHEQAWIIPVLKLSLTFCYVLLAPFVGPFADYLPKGRVMLLANFLKAAAVCGLLMGTDPTLALALAGLAAAIYAPANMDSSQNCCRLRNWCEPTVSSKV